MEWRCSNMQVTYDRKIASLEQELAAERSARKCLEDEVAYLKLK